MLEKSFYNKMQLQKTYRNVMLVTCSVQQPLMSDTIQQAMLRMLTGRSCQSGLIQTLLIWLFQFNALFCISMSLEIKFNIWGSPMFHFGSNVVTNYQCVEKYKFKGCIVPGQILHIHVKWTTYSAHETHKLSKYHNH